MFSYSSLPRRLWKCRINENKLIYCYCNIFGLYCIRQHDDWISEAGNDFRTELVYHTIPNSTVDHKISRLYHIWESYRDDFNAQNCLFVVILYRIIATSMNAIMSFNFIFKFHSSWRTHTYTKGSYNFHKGNKEIEHLLSQWA